MSHTPTILQPHDSGNAPLRAFLADSQVLSDEFRILFRLAQLGWEMLQQRGSANAVCFHQATEARVEASAHRRASTRSDLRSYTQRFLRYANFAEQPLDEISINDCRILLDEHFSCSPSVYRKAKTILQSIFAYAQRHDWCRRNPVRAIPLPPVAEEQLIPLNCAQIRALMQACGDARLCRMEAAVRLMLWCGIRPTEVQRLRWCDIDRSERCVYVEPRNSKTGGARAVPLRGGARSLLREKHSAEEFIAPRDWQRLWRRLRDRARLHPWQQDALRHTFASMHQKHFHNIVLLQEEMGHRDCSLLRSRYLNLRGIKRDAAKLFFEDDWKIETFRKRR